MASLQVSFPFKLDNGDWAEPGTTVELDDAAADQRVRDGHGRLVEGKGKAASKTAKAEPAAG